MLVLDQKINYDRTHPNVIDFILYLFIYYLLATYFLLE